MKNNIQLRALVESDLADLIELYQHLHPDDVRLDESQIETIWEKTNSSKLIEYVGLYIQFQLVSCCQKVVIPNFTRSGQPYCLVENVVTHRKYRNKGYGKRLLTYTLSSAWDEGCYKVMLMSGRKEESVKQFYQDVGFSANEKQAFVAKPIEK